MPGWMLRSALAVIAVVAGSTPNMGAYAQETLSQPALNPLERTAADYIRYREDVAAIEAMALDNPDATRQAHHRLAAHDPEALSAGWVAYAALVAADTPEFTEALKREAKKKRNRRTGYPGGKQGLISSLSQNPSFARGLDGAESAIAAVLSMTLSDGARFTKLGEAFKEQAYAMQKTTWGKKRIAPSQERLDEAATYSSSRGAPAMPSLIRQEHKNGIASPVLASADENWNAQWGSAAGAGQMNQANATAIMDRILNLAARYSTATLNPKIVEVYARNDKSNRCLSLTKLTLDQCIAATRTPYEEAFCLGEHGLIDIADCTGWIAGAGGS